MPTILVTGSSGLIGSGLVRFFSSLGWITVGIDSNARKTFFGEEGSTVWNAEKLLKNCKRFTLYSVDIRNDLYIKDIFRKYKFDLIVHAAAQCSHDHSYTHPLEDFQINTVGTVNLLEATRLYQRETPFIYFSTSKVYGTAVNEFEFVEHETRWDYPQVRRWTNFTGPAEKVLVDLPGIDESCRIDQTLHSMFGADKAAADLIAQEYGQYFGLRTVILRPGCLTGSGHSSVELHGFLSYLIKCVLEGRNYNVFGYKMKQVRDNIHSYDISTLVYEIYNNMPPPGTVFNVGGERENSISILEALDLAKRMTGKEPITTYVDQARKGDHIVYISDCTKLHTAYPNWTRKYSLERVFDDIIKGYRDR